MSTKEVKCAACDVPIKGPTNPKPEDAFACPICGIGDTYENVMREIGEQVRDEAAAFINAGLREVASKSRFMKVTSRPPEKKAYRFAVDLKLAG